MGTVLPSVSLPPDTGACLWMGVWFALAPRRGGTKEAIGISPPPCGRAMPLHRRQGLAAHPGQPGLQAETAAICLTFLAAHPNLKVTAPLCAQYLYVRMAVTPI